MPPLYFQSQPQSPMSPAIARPHPKPTHPKPLLRLHLNDLSTVGAQRFLKNIDSSAILSDAVTTVLNTLYSAHSTAIPPTRSITLVLRSMDGVAYTTGLELDSDHKEIHFNTNYISGIDSARIGAEITGVVVHEMVHCWQWNACGTAPGGLIEGIADWVRLRADLAPPHWKKEAKGNWDGGYQHTGYFLDYLERKFGSGTVMAINEGLKNKKYEEKVFWKGLLGEEVGKLWQQYRSELEKDVEISAEHAESAKNDKQQVATEGGGNNDNKASTRIQPTSDPSTTLSSQPEQLVMEEKLDAATKKERDSWVKVDKE